MIYTETKGLNFNTLWNGFILFLMLLFPYILQKRNEKAKGYYSLIPSLKNNNVAQRKRYKYAIKNEKSNDNLDLNGNIDDQINTSYNDSPNNNDIYGGTF